MKNFVSQKIIDGKKYTLYREDVPVVTKTKQTKPKEYVVVEWEVKGKKMTKQHDLKGRKAKEVWNNLNTL